MEPPEPGLSVIASKAIPILGTGAIQHDSHRMDKARIHTSKSDFFWIASSLYSSQ